MANLLLRFGIFVVVVFALKGQPAASEFSATEAKLKAALAMAHRSTESRERDENRSPVEAMRFCRLEDSMTVIEFGPGSG